MNGSRVLLLIGAAGILAGLYAVHTIDPEKAARGVGITVPSDLHPAAGERPGERRRGHEEMAALRGELAILKAEVSSLRREMRALAGAKVSVQKETAGDASAKDDGRSEQTLDPESVAHAREQAKQRREDRMAALEATFQRETADPDWSSQASAVLQEAIASQELGGASARNLACRSHICRLEVTLDHPDAMKRFTERFPQAVAETLPSMLVQQVNETDGARTLTLYLFREGYEPPQ